MQSSTATSFRQGQFCIPSLFLAAVLMALFPLFANAQSCAPTAPGLVGFWPGDYTANDFQGTSNGTLENGTLFTDGRVGPAFNTDGSDDDILIPSINIGTTFTVELWVYPTRIGGFEHLVSNGYTSTNYGALYFLNNHIEYWQGGTQRATTPTSGVPLNQWTHVAVTYNGSVDQLYINGVASGNPSAAHSETFNNSLKFGYAVGGSDTHFLGRLDEIALYNTVLTGANLLSIVNATSSGKCVAPVVLIGDASVIEGNSGTTPMNFTVSSLRASVAPSVNYSTADGTATTPGDYIATSGNLNVPANGTANIAVLVNGDTALEQNETFVVNLTNPVNGFIARAQGTGTIFGDDCVASPLGLANWYKGEGNANDSIGANNGTLENGAAFDVGDTGQAFSFDGVNDSVMTPTFSLGSAFSVELWLYPTRTSGGYENLVANDYNNTTSFGALYYHNDHIEYWQGTFVRATSPQILPLNTWTHVAMTYNGSVIQLYVNGVASGIPSITHSETFANPVRFGYQVANRDQFLRGRLDEISFYNRTLSAAEVLTVYNAGGGGKCGTSGNNWTGALSSNWNTPGNWTGGVPTASTDVVIPGNGVINEPLISTADVTVNSLNVASPRTLTINSPRTLTVNNDLINSSTITGGGTISAQGSVVNNSSTISVANFNFSRVGAQTLTGAGSLFLPSTATVVNGTNLTLLNSVQFDNLMIQSGALFDVSSRAIGVAGSFTNNGAFTTTNSTFTANGFSGPQTLTNASYANLTLSNSAVVNLGSNVTVINTLTLNKDLTTGAFVLIMPYSTQDTAGTGDVVGNFRLTTPSANGFLSKYGNPSNRIGIIGGTPPTDVTVNLVKTAPADFTSAVGRTYTITPNGGSGYTATVRLHYLDSELNGNNENAMYLWRRGTVWSVVGSTSRNTTENWIEKTNVTQFSPWTFASTNGSLSGIVTYGNAVSGPPPPRFVANVLLSGAGSSAVSSTTSFPDGTYILGGFGAGAYTVTPTKTGAVNNITSFDAAKISQHVSGAPNPQLTGNQLVVADVSGNGIISSFDAAMVAKFVAGPPYAPPGIGLTATWRFSPVSKNYASVTSNVTGEDYSGLLMGEVSGNWADSVLRPVNSGRPDRKIVLKAPHLTTVTGKDLTIPVSIEESAEKGIISYEFDLRYDPTVIEPQANPVELSDTVSSKLSFVTNAEQPGLLRVVVYGAAPIEKSGILLNLKFIAVGLFGSKSPLIWERVMFNEGDPWTTTEDGQVEISSAMPDQAASD